jgi:cell division protein FtsL
VSEKKKVNLGGNLQSSLNGEYTFNLSNLFKEASELTQTNKWIIIQMALVTIIVAFLIVLVMLQMMNIDNFQQIPQRTQLSIDLVVTGLLSPFMAALMVSAVKHSTDRRSRISDLTTLIPKTLNLAITSLMIALIVNLGLLMFILPGLYFSIACGFAILLVAEKNIPPIQSIFLSIRVVNVYWLDFIKINLVFLLLFVLVVLTFGIALIWVAPFYYHVKAILYRDLFGVSVDSEQRPEKKQEEQSTFEA